MAAEPVKIVSLNEPQLGPLTLWIGQKDALTRIPGRMDKVVALVHDVGAPLTAWRMACIPESTDNSQFFRSIIELLQQYCVEAENSQKPGQPAALPAPVQAKLETEPLPPTPTGPRRHVIPLPEGTTKEQADQLVDQIRKGAGLKITRPE